MKHELNKKVVILVVCFIVLGVLNRNAAAFEIEYGAWTTHLVSDNDYVNNKNHLIGIGYKGFETSTFINSFGDRSYSFGYRVELPSVFSVSAGVIHGYGENAKYFPVRQDGTVVYMSVNATVGITDHFAVRGRVMGEVVMVSGVLTCTDHIHCDKPSVTIVSPIPLSVLSTL